MATNDCGSSFVFTEEEVQQELARLGITNIDKASLQQFRNELQDLIQEVSASSAGFSDVTSSSVGIGSGSGTCSILSEEGTHLVKYVESSSLSAPSPLLTPPLGRNDSDDDVPMMLRKNPPSKPEQSYGNNVGVIRTAWEDDPKGPPTLSWQHPQFGSIRQVNLNSGPKQSSSVESSTMGLQQGRNSSINERISQGISSSKPATFQNKASNPDFEIGFFSEPNEIRNNKESDCRLRNKGNATSYGRSFTTLLPPENKNEKPVHHFENGNGLLLEELLRVCKSDDNNKNCPEEERNNVPPKKLTKRKIVRKDATGKTYVDESYTESESGSLLDPLEYFERLQEMNTSIYDIAAASSDKSNGFYSTRAPFSVTDNRPKSVILIPTTPPKLRKNKKSDPVNRYHQFRDYWALHKVPGESKHSELRWFIKERMMHHDQIESRPRKVYVPNDYVVPTEKHRNSLRWQIRTDLAYGFIPSSRERSHSSSS